MTEYDDNKLDKDIADAWSDVKVTEELKSNTMAAIRAARSEQEAAEKAAALVPLDSENQNNGTVVSLDSARQKKQGKPPVWRRRRLIIGLAAAIVCAIVLGFGGNAFFNTETAYASVSSQASVTLGVNRLGNVVSATAADETMQGEVDSLGLEGMGYEDAMNALIESGYLGGTEVDVQIDADADAQEQELAEVSTECLGNAGCSGSCNGNRYGKQDGSGSGSGGGSCSTTGTGNGSGNGACSDGETGSSSTGMGMGNGSSSSNGMGMGNGSGSGNGSGNGHGSGSDA